MSNADDTECERLFLKEALIITDILLVMDKRWVSLSKYISACLYFQKITEGYAEENTWNISEGRDVQQTLVEIIGRHIVPDLDNGTPHYIQRLFKHYCGKQGLPRFNGIDKIQHKMIPKLQQYFFDRIVVAEEMPQNDKKQKVSGKKVNIMFPTATRYVNEHGDVMLMDLDAQKKLEMIKQRELYLTRLASFAHI